MLLVNPVLENAVNPSAARIFASSPSGFRQTVLDCVLASKRVEGESFSPDELTVTYDAQLYQSTCPITIVPSLHP